MLQIPLAWWLASVAGFGPGGVFWSIVISESLLSVFGVAVFRHGNWRLQQV
jgi:Na+-driven multidrug efflux pump